MLYYWHKRLIKMRTEQLATHKVTPSSTTLYVKASAPNKKQHTHNNRKINFIATWLISTQLVKPIPKQWS